MATIVGFFVNGSGASNAVIERGKTWKHSAPDLHDCQTCTHAALLENYKDTVLKGRLLEVFRLTPDLVLND